MTSKPNKLALLFSIILASMLSLPALGYFFHFAPGKTLFGYVETASASKPDAFVSGWFGKKVQPYIEDLLKTNIGFRAIFIRIFNDLSFRLFSEQPRTDIFATKEHGLYFKYSIAHLNNEYINREKLTKTYDELAIKLAEIQNLLAAKGKHFEVIISSSKPYIHLDGITRRLLITEDKDIYSKIASLGSSLKNHQINVIDTAPILRDLYEKKAIETHAYSGLHWNFYTGCIIAKHLLQDMKKTLVDAPSLLCGKPEYRRAESIDRDGLLILNVYSRLNMLKDSPYPSPTAKLHKDYLPKLMIVGDSFMHQIINSLDLAKSYSTMTVSSYYRTNIKHKPGHLLRYEGPPLNQQIENDILEAALASDAVIVQMVDYNIPRMGFGFVDALLKRLKETAHETKV